MTRNVEHRNNQICEEFLDGMTYTELSRKYKLSWQQLRNILKERGLSTKDRRVKPKPKKPFHERKPLSNLHLQIGNDIAFRRTTELDLTYTQMANELDLTPQRLSEIEKGLCDVTISELRKICDFIGMDLEQLTRDRRVLESNRSTQ